MTADTTRSNILYLFQAEGAKELGNYITSCLATIHQDNSMLNNSLTEVSMDWTYKLG